MQGEFELKRNLWQLVLALPQAAIESNDTGSNLPISHGTITKTSKLMSRAMAVVYRLAQLAYDTKTGSLLFKIACQRTQNNN